MLWEKSSQNFIISCFNFFFMAHFVERSCKVSSSSFSIVNTLLKKSANISAFSPLSEAIVLIPSRSVCSSETPDLLTHMLWEKSSQNFIISCFNFFFMAHFVER
jgi:hypothetical protein